MKQFGVAYDFIFIVCIKINSEATNWPNEEVGTKTGSNQDPTAMPGVIEDEIQETNL